MELKNFIEKFAEQFDDTSVESLSGDTIFRDLEEWSSLVALSVIAMVDEEYDVTLKGDDMRNSKTINDLYNIIKAKL